MTQNTNFNSNSAHLYPSGSEEMAIPLGRQNEIGTHPTNSVILTQTGLESFHAHISLVGKEWVLRSAGPRAECRIDGVRITEGVLTDGCMVTLGHRNFTFTLSPLQNEHPTSKNPDWNEQLQNLINFSKSESTVMILGESGTGKEVLAQWIHKLSPRSKGPMTTINCSALTENLIESELFGHVRGSFTGATSDRRGAFETTRAGTLFLDEIGDLPLSLQPKLLRVLENKEVRPVGSDSTTKCDVRVVAATHKPILDMVKSGSFREDLFYRLNVCQVVAPKLIHRMEDFENLLYGFAREARTRFTYGAIESLKLHSWPGNIRELRNVVHRAKSYYPGREITPKEVKHLVDPPPENLTALAQQWGKNPVSFVKNLEKQLIIERLIFHRGSQRRVSEDLGMPKSTLNDRIQSYGINIKALLPSQ